MIRFVKCILIPLRIFRVVSLHNFLYHLGLLLIVICLFSGCGQNGKEGEEEMPESSIEMEISDDQQTPRQEESLPPQVVALVNGNEITVAELQERVHHAMTEGDMALPLDEYTLNQLRSDVLEDLIKTQLIARKAEEEQIAVTDEEFQQFVQRVQEEYDGAGIQEILAQQGKVYETWAQAQREALLLDKLIDTSMGAFTTITPEEVQQYYERNKEKYDHPAQVRASQILTYDEEAARQALQAIRNGMEFGQVAQTYSESADATSGGDLGFFARDVMPPEFDEVIFSMKMGEVSDVVKTPYGYQIFKLTDQREAHRLSFDHAQEQIYTMLKKKKRMVATDVWLSELRVNAKIVLNHDAIKQVN